MSKEWHENIPENGVLCKDDNGDIQLITEAKGIFGFRGLDYGYPLSKLTPLTAEEIWQFMPWQDMDSAPINVAIIAMDNDGVVKPITLRGIAQCSFFKKWLPLPTDHN